MSHRPRGKNGCWTLVALLVVGVVVLVERVVKLDIKTGLGGPQTDMTPEQRVQAYIHDWHQCWQAQGEGKSPTPAMMRNIQFLMRWEEAMSKLDATHWVDGESGTSSFSIPPEHDPEVERIVTIDVNGPLAKIETRRNANSFPLFTEYTLVQEGGSWKISSKLDFHDDENASPFTASEIDAWLAKATSDATLPDPAPGDSPNCDLLFKAGQLFKGSLMPSAAPVEVRPVGKISIPSGVIVARDFSYSPEDARPLSLKVTPGDYDVEVAILDETIAAVRILFQSAAQGPFVFRRAVTVDQDDSVIGVDAGNVSIADAKAFMSRTKRQHGRDYDDWARSTMNKAKRDDASLLKLGGSASANAVVVGSGHGDGGYPAFWVLNTQGQPVALVVDFWVAAEFLTRKVRIPWAKGMSGVVLDETRQGGPRIRVDANDGIASSGVSVKGIRWLSKEGTVVGDNSSVGSWSSDKEHGWHVDLTKFADRAVEMEVEYYTGYRNGP